jgi:hypothetical protein
MELTQEQITTINSKCPEDQGVFTEPWAIPSDIKEPVIYMRFSTGGWTGGSYREDSFLHPYSSGNPVPSMVVIGYVLEELGVPLTVPLFNEIVSNMVVLSDDDGADYYGNRTEWLIHYIKMSDVYSVIDLVTNNPL